MESRTNNKRKGGVTMILTWMVLGQRNLLGAHRHHQSDNVHDHRDKYQTYSEWIKHQGPQSYLPDPSQGWVTEG
jgi:hypothetical protein